MNLLPSIFLITLLTGLILIAYTKQKYSVSTAPSFWKSNPFSPFWIKKHKAWYRKPGIVFHIIGVTLIQIGLYTNLFYYALKLFRK